MENIDEIRTNKQKFGILTVFCRFLAIFPDFGGQFFFFRGFSRFQFLFNLSEIIRGCSLPWCLGNGPIFEDLNNFSKLCGLNPKNDVWVPEKCPYIGQK